MAEFNPRTLCKPGLCDMVPYQAGKSADEIEAQFGVSGAIKLASNENLLGPSPQAVEAVKQAVAGVNLYPDGDGRGLKEALSGRHGVAAEQITLGNGSNEILELVAQCFLDESKEAVYSRHAFVVYASAVKISGAKARVADPLSAQHDAMPYGHDLSAMLDLINDKTAVVFIANPNNPTGTWLSSSALKEFMGMVPAQTLVVIDEAYAEYVMEDDYPDCTQWVSEYPNLLITRTFSKLFGLAGLRIGYGVSSPEVAQLLNSLRQPFNVNSLAQEAALAALGDATHIERSRTSNKQGLELLMKELPQLGYACLPSCSNFVCCHVGEGHKVYESLARQGVIVRPIDIYELPEFLRITIGSLEQTQRLLDAMRQI